MSLTGLVPTDVTANAALAIAAIAFVSGAARGFSGFGSALIFMPLASSLAPPPLVAAVLLIIDMVAAAPLIPNGWRHADRKAVAIMALGALVGTPLGAYALTQLDPLTTRWIISAFVLALLMLLVSGWRYRGKDHLPIAVGIGGVSGFCSGLAQTGGPPIVAYWLGRPIFPLIARANILSFFAASDIFFGHELFAGRPHHIRCAQILSCGRPRLCDRSLARRQAVRQGERNPVPLDLLRADRACGHDRASPA